MIPYSELKSRALSSTYAPKGSLRMTPKYLNSLSLSPELATILFSPRYLHVPTIIATTLTRLEAVSLSFQGDGIQRYLTPLTYTFIGLFINLLFYRVESILYNRSLCQGILSYPIAEADF